jgi:hypothetical protein
MNTLHPSVAAEEIDHGRDEDEVFRYDNGGAHVYFQTGSSKPREASKANQVGSKAEPLDRPTGQQEAMISQQ